jgi:uroporphyrinogen-III synthase
MRVLVTRALEEANRTAEALAERGHDVLIAPLMDIRIFEGPELPLDGVQTILATSGNGIRALARRTGRRDIEVFAVGSHTAEMARADGFLRVVDSAGDAKALTALVRERLTPERGALLHAAGTKAPRDLGEELTRAGFEFRRYALYDVAEAERLPDSAIKAFADGLLDAVVLFSPRGAALFANCVREADLTAACRGLVACCISDAAAKALAGLAFRGIRVAPRPDRDSILDMLE